MSLLKQRIIFIIQEAIQMRKLSVAPSLETIKLFWLVTGIITPAIKWLITLQLVS